MALKVYLRLFRYLRSYRLPILLTYLMSLAVLALQGLSVWVAAGFIEKVLSNRPLGMSSEYSGYIAFFMDRIAVNLLSQPTPFRSLIVGVTVLFSAAILTGFFRAYKLYIFARINQAVVNRLRYEMFHHLINMNLSFSRKFHPGQIASLFVKDVDQLKAAIIDSLDRIFLQPLRLFMGVALMASLSLELTIWALILLGFSSLTVHFAGDRIERQSKNLAEKVAKIQAHLVEYLTTVVLARSFGKETYEAQRFNKTSSELAAADLHVNVLNNIVTQIMKNLFILCGSIIVLVGGYRVLVDGDFPGSTLLKITLLLPIVSYPMESMATLYLSIRSSVASAKRIFSFLDSEAAAADLPGAKEIQRFQTAVELRDVLYEVEGKVILDSMSLKIPQGMKVAIIGPSGAGKTSLLSVIAGLTQIKGGEIIIDGMNLTNLKGASWRKRLGIVTQESILLNGTVRENLLYVQPSANDAHLVRALREALLWNEECVFADGLDTAVGNRGELISGGERQRLAVARALLNDPDIFLMDEPTAMLDGDNKRKMYETIRSVSNGRTLVLVTHEQELKNSCDIEVHIESGRIINIIELKK